MFIRRAIHRWALNVGIAEGFQVERPQGWMRAGPFESRSPDGRAFIRVLGLRLGAYETLADFEREWPGDPPFDRRSDELLPIGTEAIRRERSGLADRRGIVYDWMEVLTIVENRSVMFTLRSVPPIDAATIEAFNTMIGSYTPDHRFDDMT